MCREVMRKLFSIYFSSRTRQDMLLNLHSRATLQNLFVSPYKLGTGLWSSKPTSPQPPLPVALRPNAGHGFLILEVSRSHTTTHHSRQDFSGRVTSPSQRPLPGNTQHSTQTDIYALGGIRTHYLSKRAAVDPRLRPRGHWDRRPVWVTCIISLTETD
jgi:hypothetical protein